MVEDSLRPYFRNKTHLELVPLEFLFPSIVDLAVVAEHPKSFEVFKASLTAHHQAFDTKPIESLTSLMDSEGSTSCALGVFWSMFHLETSRASLELEEFAYSTLSLLGSLLEGVAKPFVLALACQSDIARMQVAPVSHSAVSFGKAVESIEAVSRTGLLDIYGVRMTQWRNIAQHLSTSFQNDQIVCRYGNTNQHSVAVNRNELNQVLVDAMLIYQALKASRTIFFFDNFEQLRDWNLLPRELLLRDEARFSVLISGLATQGFSVIETTTTPEESRLVIQDMSDLPPLERGAHASQFIVTLADYRPAKALIVEYRTKRGVPFLRARAPLTLIECAREAGDFTIVARDAELTILETA